MIPRLFKPDATDFNAVGYGPITTTIRATVTEELNQAPTLEMELLATDPLLDTIIVGSIIAAKPNAVDPVQAFVVEEITKPIDGIIRIYAPHIAQHRTQLLAIPVLRITSLGTLMERISGNFFADNPFTFTLGRTGMAKPFYMTEPHSLRDIMGMIIDNYGGEWGYDNFTLTLYMKRGRESGARVLYGRNMTDFNLDEFFDFSNSVTGCYGWAKYEDSGGSEILITARGPQYSDDAWQFPYTKTVVVDFSDEIAESSTKDQATVEALAAAWINGKGAAGVTAEISFNHIDGGEDIGMGDTIRIYNNVYNYEARSRVVGLRYDVIAETYESVTIGEQRTTLSEAIQDTAGGSYSYSGGGGASVEPSTTTPLMDGTASVGTEQTYARGDHVHPTDTSRLGVNSDINLYGLRYRGYVTAQTTDLNNLTKRGIYATDATDLANIPSVSVYKWRYIMVHTRTNNDTADTMINQVMFDVGGALAFRSYAGGAWSAWSVIDGSTASSTVSLVSGTASRNVLKRCGKVVELNLRVQNMSLAANVVFGSIPSGFRPTSIITVPMLANINNAWSVIMGDIQPDGNLRFIWGSATVTQVVFHATYLIS